MRPISLALVALALGTVVACGGPETPVLVSHDVSVAVLSGHGGGHLSLDPRAARISSATQQLTAIVGHPLTFQFDVALLPDWREGFEEALSETLENVARDLDQLRKQRPQAFAYGVTRFDRVVCRYSAIVDDGRWYGSRPGTELARLDESGRAVVLTSKANRTLVPRASIASAIERSYQAYLTARFAGQEPETIAVADRAGYFAYISDGYHRQSDRDPQTQDAPSGPSELVWIPRVTRLAALVGSSDPQLALAIRAWLFAKVHELTVVYVNEAPKVQAMPPGTPWRRAEAALVAWLDSVLPTLTDDEAEIVLRNGFVPAYGGTFQHETFPGFDPFAFGLREADSWVAAGHPVTRGSVQPPARASVFANVLCERSLWRVERCSWLEGIAESDRDTQRLADALLARKDAILTTTVTRGMPGERRMNLLHRLEGDEATLGAGLRALMSTESDPAILPELRRLWRAHPQQRGAILYIVTLLDPYGGRDRPARTVSWTDFSREFVGGATRSDVASYFTQGPDVVPGARFVFAARGGRFSFVDLLLPRLDTWLVDPEATSREAGGRDGHLVQVIDEVCHDGDEAGMARMRDYFQARVAAHPGDSRNVVMDRWPRGHCRK